MPSPLSVTGPNVPAPVPVPNSKTTVNPPVVSWVPSASMAFRVTVVVLAIGTDGGATAMVDPSRLSATTVMPGGRDVSD